MNSKNGLELLGKDVLPIREALNLFFKMNNRLFQHSHIERSELLDVLVSREDWEKFPMEEKIKLLHTKEEISAGFFYTYPNDLFERIAQSKQWKELPLEKAFNYIFSQMTERDRIGLQNVFLASTLSSALWEDLPINEAVSFADKHGWPMLMTTSINRRTNPEPEKVIKKPRLQKFFDFLKP